MRAYLSPVNGDADQIRRVVVESAVRIYRSGYEVVAEVDDQLIELGLSDVTVSGRKDGEAPVLFVPQGDGIDIRNVESRNPILVSTGIERYAIETGDHQTVVHDCTVTIGSSEFRLLMERSEPGHETLSLDEFKRDLRMDHDGALLSGVSVAEYVPLLTDLLLKARNESPSECLKYTSELRTFLLAYPVEDSEYAAVCEAVEGMHERLEVKATAAVLRGSALDEEWYDRIDRIVHRVQRLYARGMRARS